MYKFILLFLAMISLSELSMASKLSEIQTFGNNPTNLKMHLYVPSKRSKSPAVVMVIHYCTTSGPDFFKQTRYRQYANQEEFILIYPTASHASKCFDVATPEALTRGGKSDATGLMSMFEYTQTKFNTDPAKQFVTGISSGGMMTNVLLALYPDKIAAGAAYAGVPFSCFETGDQQQTWNSHCAEGQLSKTNKQWGERVHQANPEFHGPYPKIQLWHGTDDKIIDFSNLAEQSKQWLYVHDVVGDAKWDKPSTNSSRERFYNNQNDLVVEVIRVDKGLHNLPIEEYQTLTFFGLVQ